MGKKHKHEKHHRHRSDRHSTDSMEYDQDPPVLIPKLIVKFGSDNTPERTESPMVPEHNQEFPESHHHHRHKEKKRKKDKKKKKSHEKDRDREHRKKKKRKREYSDDENPELYPSAPPQLTPQNPHQDTPSPQPDILIKRLCSEPVSRESPSPTPSPIPRSSNSKTTNALGKVLEYLLVMLEKKDVNNFFSNPVNDTIAPGYSTIIREPMDFSTMREMIDDGKFKTLSQFRNSFDLICNNCMTYNGPETVYFKSAKLLQRQGQRILAPERIKALSEHLPLIKDLTVEELGFELAEEINTELTVEDEKDVSKFIEEIRVSVSRPPGKFEAIPDPLLPEEVLAQAQAAAKVNLF